MLDHRPGVVVLAVTALFAWLLTGVAPNESIAAEPDATPAEAATDAYTLPEGGVEKLSEFLRGMKEARQEVSNEYQDEVRKLRETYQQRLLAIDEAEQKAAEKIMQLVEDKGSDVYVTAARIALPGRVRNLVTADLETQKSVLADVKSFLTARAEQGLDFQDFALARNTARSLEYGDHPELAIDAYRTFADLLAKSDNPQLASYATQFEAVLNRLSLIGEPLELSGTTMDGTPLDWNAYRGKVVLVDFWATWCGPCRAELPNVKKQYELYHDRGFDIVGISLDRDRQALEAFLKTEGIPWTTLHEDDGQGSHPMAEKYGITGIPTMFLVDKEGKVVSLRARGEDLAKLLAKLLGPPPAAAQEAPAPTSPEGASDSK
jgi:thiol-disulfide isomerase/thioredoxin